MAKPMPGDIWKSDASDEYYIVINKHDSNSLCHKDHYNCFNITENKFQTVQNFFFKWFHHVA